MRSFIGFCSAAALPVRMTSPSAAIPAVLRMPRRFMVFLPSAGADLLLAPPGAVRPFDPAVFRQAHTEHVQRRPRTQRDVARELGLCARAGVALELQLGFRLGDGERLARTTADR